MSSASSTHLGFPRITVFAELNSGLSGLRRDVAIQYREQKRDNAELAAQSEIVKTESRNSELFNDPSANIILETSDHVVYRVHDFFLKANSGFFRDMLSDSRPSTSAKNPLPLTETSKDWDIVLLVITGRMNELDYRHNNWTQAARLYQIARKYQLDSHQPWFTDICNFWLHESPIDALVLACNGPEIDLRMAQHAIESLWSVGPDDLYYGNPQFFRSASFQSPPVMLFPYATSTDLKRALLDASNISLRFGIALGYKASLAYQQAFGCLAAGPWGRPETAHEWQCIAIRFLNAVHDVEVEMKARI